jgi:hypothetical protein
VVTLGNNLNYQWQVSTDGGKTWKNSDAKGSKTHKMSFTVKKNFDKRYYRCRVKNGTGTVFSKKAKLTVK